MKLGLGSEFSGGSKYSVIPGSVSSTGTPVNRQTDRQTDMKTLPLHNGKQ